MRRGLRWVLAILLVQAVLVGVYLLVERRRDATEPTSLGTALPIALNMPMPPLIARRHDGTVLALPSARPTLLHVWATWCPPCREELPGLIELASRRDLDVVAVSVDESWSDVDAFLGERDAADIVLAKSEEVERALGVRDLPVTFLIDGGRLTHRFDGARDWTDDAFVEANLGKDGYE